LKTVHDGSPAGRSETLSKHGANRPVCIGLPRPERTRARGRLLLNGNSFQSSADGWSAFGITPIPWLLLWGMEASFHFNLADYNLMSQFQ
jgi:hypothetical protein